MGTPHSTSGDGEVAKLVPSKWNPRAEVVDQETERNPRMEAVDHELEMETNFNHHGSRTKNVESPWRSRETRVFSSLPTPVNGCSSELMVSNLYIDYPQSSTEEKQMNSQMNLLVFTLAIVLAAAISEGQNAGGGWSPIRNLTYPHVKDIVVLTLSEHNKAAKTTLKLKSILKGEEQVVSGMNYKLVLCATEGTATGNYLAVVYDITWESYRSLTEFSRFP
ncbi:hypothetical protein HS088_TW03G00383 [Tripterygium wilfordii]|uniref:Cystatin domain-containing protein n=1 Tax=Tripterygium wilfordii TaxID=458696 RepID=A0A7J7DUS9_TRIWF|nr:hypothetical protein HS088_TW03G00383 [Tripterygium wilfordii]